MAYDLVVLSVCWRKFSNFQSGRKSCKTALPGVLKAVLKLQFDKSAQGWQGGRFGKAVCMKSALHFFKSVMLRSGRTADKAELFRPRRFVRAVPVACDGLGPA